MGNGSLTIAAVGDVMANRKDPLSILAKVGTHLTGADFAFCQLESMYSALGSRGSCHYSGAIPHDVSNYPVLPGGGFDVVSVASNHAGDYGEDALLDVIAHMRRDGIHPLGGGANLGEARAPVILEHNGSTVAFLGYCSVAPTGYYAGPNKWGVAPMRAITHYQPFEDYQPGTPCEILTYPEPRDLDRFVADIHQVRDKADVVIVSLHWGVHFVRALIADYQPVVARAAVEAGADLILGHHPHKLKAVEVITGKAVFYSIGNFAFDYYPKTWHANSGDVEWNTRKKKVYMDQFGWKNDAEPGSKYAFESDAKYTLIVKVRIEDKKIAAVSYVPVVINREAQPVPYRPSDPEGKEMIDYLTAITEEAGMPSNIYRSNADEVTIITENA